MKQIYTCPMHPEIQQDKQGRCPKCGMELVLKEKSSNVTVSKESPKTELSNYFPLVVVIGMILLVTLALSYKDVTSGYFNLSNTISYFMIGFFLTFSGFKLIGLKGFAQGYYTYDLLAKKWFGYGYVYPFLELFFGLAMIFSQSKLLLTLEFVVMAFSGVGVAIKLLKKERFQCVCLGTFLKVPLTKITLVEDFGMALLALILLIGV